MTNTVLTQPFNTPHQSVPFEEIKEEDFLPAIQLLIEKSEKEIDDIANSNEEPTFANTIEAMAYSGEQLNTVSGIFFNLNSAETNDKIQQLAQEISPLLSQFSSKISQNENLFKRIKKIYDDRENLSLNEEQKTLLDDTYKGFVRSGALLENDKKKELEKLNMDLALKSLKFGENALAATNRYYKHITDKALLKGIPESVIQQYEEEAKERDLEGYVITLQFPSYFPAMKYAENRKLREELSLAQGQKNFNNDEFDNQKLIQEIVQLRQQKAELLGYKNFAEYVLEERMAKSPQKVFDFLNEIKDKATPYAQKEFEELKEMAKKDGIEDIQSYDHAFYAEKLREQRFNLNEEELKTYFPLNKVQEAVFKLAGELFNIEFKEVHNIQKYHKDVQTFEILENSEFKALLYTDYHPRKGKRTGAWMTSYKNQYKKDGKNVRPHVSVVCNFTKPTKDQPSLLTFNEVTTLFHEFGHALHGAMANTQYPNLSGTSVKWDFVELPSQFLENYCYEPEFLQSFAKHYQTGEVLSEEKIKKLADSKNFMEGYQTLRQISFGLLDMSYHTEVENTKNIKQFEVEKTKECNLYPDNSKTMMSTSFSHIFQGGYSAGYYSYKWAEVLDADAFQYFKENGIFNKEIAEKYKELISSGGTIDPMKLYINFRGREPKVESLLKRAFG